MCLDEPEQRSLPTKKEIADKLSKRLFLIFTRSSKMTFEAILPIDADAAETEIGVGPLEGKYWPVVVIKL